MSWLFALRRGRIGVAGFSVLAFAITLSNTLAFYALAGGTPADRRAFGSAIDQLAVQFGVLVAPPLRPDTVGGFVQFRAYGALAILLSIWAVVSAAGATRGDEERGIVEAVLSAGVSRADALAGRVLAFAGGCLLAAAAAALGLVTGVAHAGETIDGGSVLAATVILSGIALCSYALAAMVCQLVAPRLATAAAGMTVLTLFFLNSLGRSIDVIKPWRWLSPFYYFDRSAPLPPAGPVDVRATEVLFVIAAVAAIAAILAFDHRDLGSPLIRLPARRRRESHDPAHFLTWGLPVIRGVYERRAGFVLWIAGVSGLGALFVVLTRDVVKPLLALQTLQPFFSAVVKGDIYPSFLGYIWFGVAQLLIAGYAITQVVRWAAEDGDGRLELALSTPHSRTAVVLERALVGVLGAIAIAVLSALAVHAEAQRESIDVALPRLLTASILLVPFSATFMAAGAVLTATVPRAAAGVLGALAITGYFITQLAPVFKWPGWVLDLSPFHLYGQPLASGVDGTGLAIMLVVAVVGFGGSALLMQRRDIGG